jgi:hypothetical protein
MCCNLTFLTIVGQKIHGGSLTRPHASPHRPSPTPKASRSTFPTSSAVDAHQTSPVPASVAHFQSPGESACRSLEGILEMGGEQSAGGRREGSRDFGQQDSARLPESGYSYEVPWRNMVCTLPFFVTG